MEGVNRKMCKYVLNYATRVILKKKNGKLQDWEKCILRKNEQLLTTFFKQFSPTSNNVLEYPDAFHKTSFFEPSNINRDQCAWSLPGWPAVTKRVTRGFIADISASPGGVGGHWIKLRILIQWPPGPVCLSQQAAAPSRPKNVNLPTLFCQYFGIFVWINTHKVHEMEGIFFMSHLSPCRCCLSLLNCQNWWIKTWLSFPLLLLWCPEWGWTGSVMTS